MCIDLPSVNQADLGNGSLNLGPGGSVLSIVGQGRTLATVDTDGLPNLRMVLLKGYDGQGFVFYTNTESAKGRELDAVRKGAL